MDITIDDYPELRAIAWNLPAEAVIPGPEALSLYERNWRHVDQSKLSDRERSLILELAVKFGNGVLNI